MRKLAYNSTFEKLNYGIQSHHFVAHRWGNSGNSDSSKTTADGDAAMKLKDLLLERKAMTNLGSIFKSRNFTLPTKSI